MGLLLPCEFGEGTLLTFELPPADDQPPRQALVRVIRALAHGGAGWFLGCEFADQLSERELLSLVG